MAECECLRMTCAVFFSGGVVDELGLGAAFRHRYCCGPERDSCARLVVRNQLGPFAVPRDLWPTHTAAAERLLADAGR